MPVIGFKAAGTGIPLIKKLKENVKYQKLEILSIIDLYSTWAKAIDWIMCRDFSESIIHN